MQLLQFSSKIQYTILNGLKRTLSNFLNTIYKIRDIENEIKKKEEGQKRWNNQLRLIVTINCPPAGANFPRGYIENRDRSIACARPFTPRKEIVSCLNPLTARY